MIRDYYEVLGVNRDADVQEIKKAYRRLARECHPDINAHDPRAEEKFKEATEAYEVLCDPEKRQLYDRYGHAAVRGSGMGGPGFGGFADFTDLFDVFFGGDLFGRTRSGPAAGPARGQDVAVEVEIELEEAAFGISKDVVVQVLDVCRECGGSGAKDLASIRTCPECGGSGRLRRMRQTVFGQFVQTGVCARCRGEGMVIEDPCLVCRGGGRAYREKTLSVEIPAGISHGQRIRLSGQGAAGERGGRYGDLYVLVSVAQHPVFERDGDDLFERLDVTMTQAALGALVTVATLEGEEEMSLPPGTQPGEVIVLRARGVPHLNQTGRGDLRLVINVMIPRNLDEQQKALLQELDECCGPENYAPSRPEGILHRLKNLFAG